MPDQFGVHEAIGRVSNRVTELRENVAERMDTLAERLEGHLNRIEARIMAKVEQMDEDTQREFREARHDLGDLRDRLTIVEGVATGAKEAAETAQITAKEAATASRAGTTAAVGAMRTATDTAAAATIVATDAAAAAMIAVPKETAQVFWASSTGRFLKWCTAIGATGAAIAALPVIVKFAVGVSVAMWKFLTVLPLVAK